MSDSIGLMAAGTIVAAGGEYDRATLEAYRRRIRRRFGVGAATKRWRDSRSLPSSAA